MRKSIEKDASLAAHQPDDHSHKEKGRGLNSIPVRFALMSFVLCSMCFGLQFYLYPPATSAHPAVQYLILCCSICFPALVTYFAARKLAGTIGALHNSTLAILEGEVDTPVDVDCACEVGGLADSFRAMVARLNSNILRMNMLAYTDSVTRLPNRAVINHVLDLASSKAEGECSGSMFFIDLDGFKRVNDTLGHDAGDELLRQASLRIVTQGFGVALSDLETCTNAYGELCRTCPTGLVFARFAGDEFVALLPGSHSYETLSQTGHSILAALEEPFEIFGNEITIGASIGIARLDKAGSTPRDLLAQSDIAMYRAKELGRNCLAFFDEALHARVAERRELEQDLRTALEFDELSLHFQPKVCVRTNAIVGTEALARWNHPAKGEISPEIFIPIAEQSGAMQSLGQTVLGLAARQAQEWQDAGLTESVAINVSPVQFEAPELVPMILGTLDRHHLDPRMLELEITETLAMSDYASTRIRLDALRSQGVRIAIDDFGTGYSNLSQLARLSFDAIKIDKSLVSGIGRSVKSETMLDTTIKMAHSLGYEVVAEGIETLEQFTLLKELGCDQVQGFYVAPPMKPADLQAWRKARSITAVGQLQGELFRKVAAA